MRTESRARRTRRSPPRGAIGPPKLASPGRSGRGSGSDAADVDSRRPQLLHPLRVGSGISENDVDLVEIADMAEGDAPELGGVGHDNDPLRSSGGGAFDRRLGEEMSSDAGLHVDTAGTHHTRVESELRERRLGETPHQRQLARTDLATREKKFDARAL